MSKETSILPVGAANVTIEITINAPVSKTWNTMIANIGQWWRKDFLICEDSQGMTLEPRIGGLLRENAGAADCGFVWGNIISYQPQSHLAYIAQIVPPWGGPAQSVVQISLKPGADDPENSTLLTLTDSIVGHLTDDLVSGLDEGWNQLYGEGGLKTYVEAN
jgi:uncharacterized protein YndB with AHSA1/START domain